MAPWVVVLSGLGVMVLIFLVAAGCVPMQSRATGEVPPPDLVTPAPEPRPAASPPINTGGQLVAVAPPPSGQAILAPAPPSPSLTPSAPVMPPPAASTPPAASAPAPPPATTAAPPPPPPPVEPKPNHDLVGRYRVLDQYGDAFIAEVLVVNTSSRDQDWTVTLRFPRNVGRLYAAWVEGAPQASMTRSGSDYVFRGGVPVGGRSSVPLRFHFERHGSGARPDRCAVNGAGCLIR
ncbi:cellulose binding domain-containing protein [Solwaraspora sp. WMMD406]|uniref:cellulose binding domain-containing protein n=1 Tax=Solwaraspora sp. WMMD406 TaxID=3016095 RepID=UPI002418135D|nr:cellulose binding domain-containing protein [Solwaraspora sp. WMMD406]MDG4765566.1 cellulose binding domain-containing protein [Solwaraspora sp. WMMD406]